MSNALAEGTGAKLHPSREHRAVTVAGGVVAALVVWALYVPIGVSS